jgi:hypothetical protein
MFGGCGSEMPRFCEEGMMYRHVQFGKGIVVILGLVLAATVGGVLVVIDQPGEDARYALVSLAVASAVMALALVLFYRLVVEVNAEKLVIRFGIGWIRKSYPLAAIRSAQAVRNPWYYGLGIHRITRGWVYNVSGADAVEIVMDTGRANRIGTDDPTGLLAAIGKPQH